jgi:hypothetical protein
MSDECTERGGTEPLAALVSVAAICVAVSVYAGVASEVLPDSDDNEPDAATLDSVWTAVSDDGVLDTSGPLEARLGAEPLPRGHRVAVNVTVVGADGHLVTVAAAQFETDATVADLEPPPTAAASDRPVPVRIDEGDVRPGRLTVVVWNE